MFACVTLQGLIVEFVPLQALEILFGDHFCLLLDAFRRAVLDAIGLCRRPFFLTEFFFAGLAKIYDVAHG